MKSSWIQPLLRKEVSNVVGDARVAKLIQFQLTKSFSSLGLPPRVAMKAVKKAIAIARAASSDASAEFKLKHLLADLRLRRKIDLSLNDRAALMFSQIRSHLIGRTVLDAGCGDGLVSQRAEDAGYVVKALDVVDYRVPKLHVQFRLVGDGDVWPLKSASVDNVLLLTVLHHSEVPLRVLGESVRIARKRVVVIESVFGVQPQDVKMLDKHARAFARLGSSQASYTAFIDWFYNRVIHDDVPVPLRFRSVNDWRVVFRDFGLRELRIEHLGLDQSIVPEYHVLYVLEKRR